MAKPWPTTELSNIKFAANANTSFDASFAGSAHHNTFPWMDLNTEYVSGLARRHHRTSRECEGKASVHLGDCPRSSLIDKCFRVWYCKERGEAYQARMSADFTCASLVLKLYIEPRA